MVSGLGKGIEDAIRRIEQEGISITRHTSPLEKERGLYRMHKESWFFHPYSGCSPFGCVPECPFHAEQGRIVNNIIVYTDGSTREIPA